MEILLGSIVSQVVPRGWIYSRRVDRSFRHFRIGGRNFMRHQVEQMAYPHRVTTGATSIKEGNHAKNI
jgi:hypothetical protein